MSTEQKPRYDRHRRIRKRINVGGRYLMGCWLPDNYQTWGEIVAAKKWAQEVSKRLKQFASSEPFIPRQP